jgi:hypothetical protein
MRTLFTILLAVVMLLPLGAVQQTDPPRGLSKAGGGKGTTGDKGPTGDAGAAGVAGASGVPYVDYSWFAVPNIGGTPTTATISTDGYTIAHCSMQKTQKETTAVTLRFKVAATAGTVMTWEEIGIGHVPSIPGQTVNVTMTVAVADATTLLSVGTGVKSQAFTGLTIPAGVHLCGIFSQNGDATNGTLTAQDNSDPLIFGSIQNTNLRPSTVEGSTATMAGYTTVPHNPIIQLIPTW